MAQTARTEWTDTAGLKHTVETTRGSSETAAAWSARHKEGVDAMKALFPPAPVTGQGG